MPEYRSGVVRGGSQFAGVGRFLNLKRVFDDAVRQERWTKERDVLQSNRQLTQTGLQESQLKFNQGNNGLEIGVNPDYDNMGYGMNTELLPEGMEVAGYNAQGKAYLRKLPKLTDTESQKYENAESINIQLQDLKSIIQEDATKGIGVSLQKAQFPVVGAFTEQGQRYRLIRGDISDRLLRMRSGAQINEQEFKRLNQLLPRIFRRENIDLEQLNKFEREFSRIQERIRSGRVGLQKEQDEQAQQPNQIGKYTYE